jgi:hypothetical protein
MPSSMTSSPMLARCSPIDQGLPSPSASWRSTPVPVGRVIYAPCRPVSIQKPTPRSDHTHRLPRAKKRNCHEPQFLDTGCSGQSVVSVWLARTIADLERRAFRACWSCENCPSCRFVAADIFYFSEINLTPTPNQRHDPRRPAPDKRGASRSSRTLSAGCDGRIGSQRALRADERSRCGRRSRVVLASRR